MGSLADRLGVVLGSDWGCLLRDFRSKVGNECIESDGSFVWVEGWRDLDLISRRISVRFWGQISMESSIGVGANWTMMHS